MITTETTVLINSGNWKVSIPKFTSNLMINKIPKKVMIFSLATRLIDWSLVL